MSARFQTVGPIRALRPIAIATILALATFGLSAMGTGEASAAPGSPRIVGGTDIDISLAPYQVALIDATAANDRDGQFCGGSILSKRIIVTAAHCFDAVPEVDSLRILAGSPTLSDEDQLADLEVSAVTLHPDWDAEAYEANAPTFNYAHDIAIIELAVPLTFQAGTIEAISLPSSDIGADIEAFISGWGYTGYKNNQNDPVDSNEDELIVPLPTELQGATVFTGTDAICSSSIGAKFESAFMLCAGDFSDAVDEEFYAQDTCSGDSGGPLALTTGETNILAGITSWGVGCAWQQPGVYTKVSNYVAWIKTFAGITYSATTFEEAAANNGSITTSATITLSGDTFTGADNSALGTVTNVPAGLTAVLKKASATTATLSFTGNATTHTNARDISNLTVTFGNADFTGGIASLVTGATKSDLVVNFADPASLAYSATTFVEAAANNGSITTTVTITLSGDTFEGDNDDPLGTVENVPAGLTAVLVKASATTATLNFTGNATTHTNGGDISNLTVTFDDSDFTAVDAAEVIGSTKSDLVIDFAPSSLAYSATTFDEAAANDGSITATVTITLSGDTFTGTNGAALGTVTNVPAGLTADLVRASATTATLRFTGNATTHTNDRDISNLTVTFANSDFTGGDALAVTGATKNNLVINFADPATSGGGGGGGGVSSPAVIVTPPSTGLVEPVRARVSGFAGNSATLNKTARADIREALRDNPAAKTATCRAFAPTGATAAETTLARSRAAATCAYIAKKAPALKLTVIKRNLKATTESQERAVRLIFG
jgi:secreted trypsin-like serine protease